MIKTTQAKGTPSRTVSSLDLTSDLNVSEGVKARIKQDVGDYLLEQVVAYVQGADTPIQGESWPALSKEYKQKKQAEGLPGKANMEFEGDMLDALDFKETPNGIDIGFFGEEAWKADGHLKFSGKDNGTPQRRFLPGEGQQFVPEIHENIGKIIADAIADEGFKRSDFKNVESRSELHEILSEKFPGLSRSEIRRTVAGSEALMVILEDLDLLDWL